MGEMIDHQLPLLVQFNPARDEDLAYWLMMEAVILPTAAQVETYFATNAAENVMPQPTILAGVVSMNLSNLCPIPLAWAPYFLDFKDPFIAYEMGKALMTTLTDARDRAMAGPMLDWLRAACARLGNNGTDRNKSLLN
jgi:hypothetical protein